MNLDMPPSLPVNMQNMIPENIMPNMMQGNIMPNMVQGYMIPNMNQGNMMPNLNQGNIMSDMNQRSMQNINPINPLINSYNNICTLNNQAPLANSYNYQNINSINNCDFNANSNYKDNSQIYKKEDNFSLTFLIIEKNEQNHNKLVLQVKSDLSIKDIINNFKTKYGYNFKYIKKFLIDDKIELDPSSEETLQEKGINEQTKIMAYKE